MKKITLLVIVLLSYCGLNAQIDCNNAITITPDLYTMSEYLVNSQVPTPLCADVNGPVPANRPPRGSWYKFTPTQNLTVTVTTDIIENNPRIDTRFHVYKGSCDNLICHSGDDDAGVGENNYSSIATFQVEANQTYYLAFDNKWNNSSFKFKLIYIDPALDPCNLAPQVTTGITTISSISGQNLIAGSCNASATKVNWYRYEPTNNYNVTITSDLPQNICKDTNLNVYRASCPGNFTCMGSDDNSGIIVCGTDNSSNLSTFTFEAIPGNTYFIAWDNKWSDDGFDFQIIENIADRPVNYSISSITELNSSYSPGIADMNNDGLDDLVGITSNNLSIRYQNANGGFTTGNFAISGTSKMPSWSMVAGDFNKDGFNDVVLGGSTGLSLWKSNSNGTAYSNFSPNDYIFCQRTNFVDINNDGHLDIFSCHDIDPNVYYLNDGNGNGIHYQSGITEGAYRLGVLESGGNYASLWTDFDNDGDLDLFISKCSGPPCELHRNDGNGVFTDISAVAQVNLLPVQSWSSAVADFDNDGDMDIIIGSNGSRGHIFLKNNLDTNNNTEEAFTDISAGSGLELDNSSSRDYIAYDFDNDGFVDIMGSGRRIFFNKGNNRFEIVSYPSVSIGAVGDLNNDGFLDIADDTRIHFAIPNGNNWLKIVTKGIESNANGIGARIEIYGSFGKQIRDVRSGEGFEFMSTLNTHFGLGQSTMIDQLVIKWPSGVVDTFTNVNPNQTLTVTEGQTLATNTFDRFVFTVYPNPVKDIINIKLNTALPVDFTSAIIYDLSGRLISKNKVSNDTVDVTSINKGTYILKLVDSFGKEYSQKFIKE